MIRRFFQNHVICHLRFVPDPLKTVDPDTSGSATLWYFSFKYYLAYLVLIRIRKFFWLQKMGEKISSEYSAVISTESNPKREIFSSYFHPCFYLLLGHPFTGSLYSRHIGHIPPQDHSITVGTKKGTGSVKSTGSRSSPLEKKLRH